MPTVSLNKMIEKLDLKNLTPDIATDGIEISSPDINRPALQLAGYFEHFACERVQIIGYVEYTYLKNQDKEEKLKNYERFMSSKIPVSSMHHGPNRMKRCMRWRENITNRCCSATV